MKQSEQLLYESIKNGDFQKVKENLAISQSYHCLVDQNKATILHVATNNNQYQITQYFLKKYDERGQTHPQCNIQNKREWVNKKDKDGFCALHYAVFRGNYKLATLLEAHYADIYTINSQGLNVLHIAAQGDSPCLMFYYLHKGFKISCTDFTGCTPLHWACYSGQQNAVNALLAWQAEIDRQDTHYGMTPLHLAVMSGNGRIVKKLLLRGCDRNVKNFNMKLPLQIAQQNQYQNIQEMILDKNILKQILNIKTPYRKTQKYTYHFYFLIITFLLNYILNISFIISQHFFRIFEMSIIFLSLGFLCILLFLLLRCVQSGKLKPEQSEKSYFFQTLIKNQPQQICYDCEIVKPARSRHCEICQSCICVFDHHCPWIAKCVGAGNYFFFYSFLLSMEVFLLYSIVFEIFNLLVNDWSVFSPLLFIRSFCICLSLLTCALFLIPLSVLLYIQTRNCCSDKTTFQTFSSKIQNRNSSTSESRETIKIPLLESDNIKSSRDISKTASMFNQKNHSNEQIRLVEGGCCSNCFQMCCTNKNNISYRFGGL